MRPGSVRLQLTLWGVAVLSVAFLIFGGVLRYQMQSDILRSVDRDIANFSSGSAERWRDPSGLSRLFGMPGPPPHDGSGDQGFPDHASGNWQIAPMHLSTRYFTLGGKSMQPTDYDGPWDRTTLTLSAKEDQAIYSTIRANGEQLRIYSLPLRDETGQIAGVLQTARSLADMQWSLDRLTRSLLQLIIPCLVIAGIGGAFLTSRALSPVRRIILAASAIEAQDLSARLPTTGGDEFAELASTFNGMLGRLETAFEQQRRFVADASHELKTPLAAIKAHTSLSLRGKRTPEQYRQTLQIVDRSTDSATRIVQDLLLLARSDTNRLIPQITPVCLADILTIAADMVTDAWNKAASTDTVPEADIPSITIRLSDPTLHVMGDAHYLTRLFTNLVENAVRYTPPHGTVEITATSEADRVLVEVKDTGIGIAPEHLTHVSERFYRVDDARDRASGGIGLGLSICQSIVSAHGGTLTLQSEVGQGTCVTVSLPDQFIL